MYVCVQGGCSLVLGNAGTELGGGWSSYYCALCKLTALAPASKASSILQHQSLHPGPAKRTDWPFRPTVPSLPLLGN